MRALPVAGLGVAGGIGNDGAVAALVARLHFGDVRQETVIAGLDEGGAGVGDLVSVIVHADEPCEVAVGTPRWRDERSVEAALVRQVGSGDHSVDAGFDCRCALSRNHPVLCHAANALPVAWRVCGLLSWSCCGNCSCGSCSCGRFGWSSCGRNSRRRFRRSNRCRPFSWSDSRGHSHGIVRRNVNRIDQTVTNAIKDLIPVETHSPGSCLLGL